MHIKIVYELIMFIVRSKALERIFGFYYKGKPLFECIKVLRLS